MYVCVCYMSVCVCFYVCVMCISGGLLKENLCLVKTLFLVLKLNGSFGMNLALIYLFMLAELSKMY